MPLSVGKSWTYKVQLGLDATVETVRVVRRVAVAGAPGFELKGPLGVSRLAWRGGILWADQLASAFVTRPLPLLAGGEEVLPWRGFLIWRGEKLPAKGELRQSPEKLEVGTQAVPTTRTTLLVNAPGQKIEVKTWFQEGVGIVRQEQRTNERLVVAISLVSPGG